jgi:hypothetical protein
VVIDPHADALAQPEARLIHLLRAQLAQDLMQDSTAAPVAHIAPAVH